MEEDTNARTYAEQYARTITVDVEGADDPAEAAAELVHDALGADYVVTGRGNVKAVHLIVGTGGPHVEVQYVVGGRAVHVVVWWWRDYADAYAYAPALTAELDGLADAWQEAYIAAGVHR